MKSREEKALMNLEKEIKEMLKEIPDRYYKVGEAGILNLYEKIDYCGTTKGTKSWIVDFGNGQICALGDRLTPKELRRRQFDIPENTPKNWKKIEI